MEIIFTGDVFTGGDLVTNTKHIDSIISSKTYNEVDRRVINLENPLSETDIFSNKSILYAPAKEGIQTLFSLKVDVCNLANNHIHDKGITGIEETVSLLRNNGIKYFGAGKDLNEAKKAVRLDENLYILGYCQYNSPTLNKIQLASNTEAGVNPLNETSIIEDIHMLPEKAHVILYFHWGQEHLWLTDYSNISLAKRLLAEDRVIAILGMHPHRPQGIYSIRGKKCYFCLGNFLFPNFYISPPSKVTYEKIEESYSITYRYHPVSKVTKKKWKLVNRLSIGVVLQTDNMQFREVYFLQDRDKPTVRELRGIKRSVILIWVKFISMLYYLPSYFYKPLQFIHKKVQVLLWNLGILVFKIKQDGWRKTLLKIKGVIMK